MTQYAFYFDQSRCYGCQSCTVACKDWNHHDPGQEQWMNVYEFEEGTFPEVKLNLLAFNCGHCDNPVCVPACPNDAIFKEDKYGAVLVDQDKCKGTRQCVIACPYGSPTFKDDKIGTKMSKCTMCIDRLERGESPVCVQSCPLRALDFGPVDEMIERYGDLRKLKGMPKPFTKPNYIVKPNDEKKNLVSYPVEKALDLMKARGDMDNVVVKNVKDITEFDDDTVTRSDKSFKMRPTSMKEKKIATKNDNG